MTKSWMREKEKFVVGCGGRYTPLKGKFRVTPPVSSIRTDSKQMLDNKAQQATLSGT